METINAILRLEFEHVFPDKKKQDVLFYLKKASPHILLNVIGFLNIYPPPNFDNFISDPEVSNDIIRRVIKYSRANNIREKPILVSRESCLRLAELILSNQKSLIENNHNNDKDADEINLFKAFLVINGEVNSKQKPFISGSNFEKLVDMSISLLFPMADIGVFENNNLELGKLIYTTIIRFEYLVGFLHSNKEYDYLEKDLSSYFAQINIEEVSKHMKYLFAKLLQLRLEKEFKFRIEDEDSLAFLNTLISVDITEDDDFTNLRNHPIYRIDESTYSVIDFLFVIDKFYRSVKFILKNSFNKNHGLPPKDGTFFNFFNTQFSEEFLMKNVLDKIFNKPYFIKKSIERNKDNEPDYYVRHGNRIYLFENKDVLIAKNIKRSGNIEKINNILKLKFLEANNKPRGIGQLITIIHQIVENTFRFDKYANSKKNLTIYPILLINDRIFEIPGINYRLNQWYLEKVKTKLGNKYNPNFIKSLTVIDIDTLIYWTPYLVKQDSNFRKIIDLHLKNMRSFKKVSHTDPERVEELVRQNLINQIAPISTRLSNYKFPIEFLREKFDDIKTEYN